MTKLETNDLPFSIKKINVSSEGKRKLIGEWKIEPPIFPPIDFSDETVEFIKDELLEEIKKEHDKQLNAVLIHPEVYKYLTKKQYKKIKRRIFYEISWWGAESRYTKCFYSAKKMRNFVNELHSWYNEGFIEIEKTWGYREYSPRHKWFYVSYRPNQFVCVERY